MRDPVGWVSGRLGKLLIKVTFAWTQARGISLATRMWEETNLCKVNCLRELPVNILVPDSENH